MPIGASVTCAECGATYMRRDASDDKRHAKTQKHQAAEQTLAEEKAFTDALDAERQADDLDDDSWDDLEPSEPTPVEINKAMAPRRAGGKGARSVMEAKHVIAKEKAKPTVHALNSAGSKECRVCHKTKALTEFRAKASRPDGRDTLCAACASAWLVAHKAKAAK